MIFLLFFFLHLHFHSVTEKRKDFGLIRANVGLLDFYGSGLTYSLVVSCIVIHIFTWDVSKRMEIMQIFVELCLLTCQDS